MSKKIIALVGRPNVGKSTLFNRLSVNKKAIVHDRPGVTRDRKYTDARIGPLEFVVIDTPGLEESAEDKIEYRMMQQTIMAIQEADLVCLIVDHQLGITPEDKVFAHLIRKNHKNYVLVANKVERDFLPDPEYYKMGFGDPAPISAEHGMGMINLYEAFTEKLPDKTDEKENTIEDPYRSKSLQVVVAGRPNSGKSTFINAILGHERLLTGPEAGITRESIEVELNYKDQPIKLIDTAGLRKKANVHESLERLSTKDSTYSIRFANLVVLMVDATIALEQQDLHIAQYVLEQGRGLVIAINKWDLIKQKESFKKNLSFTLDESLSQAQGVPVVFLSALNQDNIDAVLDESIKIFEIWNRRIPTNKLNQWLEFALEEHPLPLHKKLGRRIRIKYITQIKARPPTFKLFCNDPDSITDHYQRYLVNALRRDFKMPGVPIRMVFSKTDNPYADKKK
jgi:GTP-binding protein